jgi:limonene-1,2-epoxide hydrolase
VTDPAASLAVVERLIAAWEARDVRAIAACFTSDGVWHNMPYPPIAGREAISESIKRFLAGVEHVRFEVQHAGVVAPGVVMNERVDSFRQQGGKELRIPVTGVFELRDGLIHVWRDYFDSSVMSSA